ncbi:MAG: hypothetical protein NWF07_01355 [Candidatus Bathyarchaeota archaeon]|nr:hypothetical protein [Candidatus Bathyarchaeota archaeon]
MVFNIVRVVRVEPGASLDGTVFDQWIHIEFGGSTASVFDPDMIAPEYASGEIHELKLSLMATSVEPSNSSARGVSGNWYYGRVVSVYRRESLYDHILDINGLKIHLLENKEHSIGEYLSVRGRLDLDDIKYPNAESWTTA